MDGHTDRAHQYAAGDLTGARLAAPAGAHPALRTIPAILEDAERSLANPLCRMISLIYQEVRQLEACIDALERELRAVADADPVATRLRDIPGIGLLTSTVLVGTVGHIYAFRRARQFASWLGSVYNSSGLSGQWSIRATFRADASSDIIAGIPVGAVADLGLKVRVK